VTLTSQSALQVHPSPDGITHLQSSYHVDDGAHLHCHWHPLIPFADARIDQRIDVNIAGGGYLYWSDALMSCRGTLAANAGHSLLSRTNSQCPVMVRSSI